MRFTRVLRRRCRSGSEYVLSTASAVSLPGIAARGCASPPAAAAPSGHGSEQRSRQRPPSTGTDMPLPPPPPCGNDGHASGRRAAARLLLRRTRINPSTARRVGEAAPENAGPSQPRVEKGGGPRGEGGAAPAARFGGMPRREAPGHGWVLPGAVCGTHAVCRINQIVRVGLSEVMDCSNW